MKENCDDHNAVLTRERFMLIKMMTIYSSTITITMRIRMADIIETRNNNLTSDSDIIMLVVLNLIHSMIEQLWCWYW